MIGSTWHGWVAAADGYLDYLHETDPTAYRATPGNRGVYAFRRAVGDRAELLLVTLWEDQAAIRAFAGDEINRAIFYPKDDAFLIHRETHVDHFEVVHASLA